MSSGSVAMRWQSKVIVVRMMPDHPIAASLHRTIQMVV